MRGVLSEVTTRHSYVRGLLRLNAAVVVRDVRDVRDVRVVSVGIHSRVESLLIVLLNELRLILNQSSLLMLELLNLLLEE